ncbi:MAG: hypothetical protein ACK41D_07435 [Rubricoccaceae bacterium]
MSGHPGPDGLLARPTHAGARDFYVCDAEGLRALVRLPSGWAGTGQVFLGQAVFDFRAPLSKNEFSLLLADVLLARTRRQSVWRTVYEAEIRAEVLGRSAPLMLRLAGHSGLVSRHTVEALGADGNAQPLGEIRREGIFRRRVRLHLSRELPLLAQVYLLTVALTLWQRQGA